MKRNKWTNRLFSLCILIAAVACYDDKGNYEYNWVQDVFLKEDLQDTTVERGTALVLRPELYKIVERGSSLSEPVNPDDYTYSWTVGTGTTKLSENKDLNDTIWLATGASHQITYKITEKRTNVSWLYKFNLRVIQQLNSGYLFLTEDEQGRVEAEIYATDARGKKVHQSGILERSGFPYRGGGANCVASLAIGNAVLNKYLMVSTGEGSGWLTLPDFNWKERQMMDFLMVKKIPGVFSIKSAYQLSKSAALYFTATGEAHVHNTYNIIYSDFAILNKMKFKAAPYVGGNNYAAIIYNEDRHCFCFYAQGSQGFDMPGSYCTPLKENLAHEGSSLIYMQQVSGNLTVAIIKDKDGTYQQLTFAITGRPGLWELTERYAPTALLGNIAMIEQAQWIVADANNRFVYFALDGRLYNYRKDGGIDNCEPARVLKDGQEVPLDETVSLNVITNNSTGSSFQGKIYIATYSTENKGRIYIVKPETTESRNLIVEEVIELEGKVKSVCNWPN